MKFSRDMLLLYAVTDRTWTGKQSLCEQVECAIAGGVTCVQLREKEMCSDELIKEAENIKRICHRYGVPLIINDDADVAMICRADGVHVGISDSPVSDIRKKAGSDFIIGATAKTTVQAIAAEEAGADYIGVGAVFPSPTQKNAIRISRKELSEICSSVSIPAVAIGGIDRENALELAGCKIAGIAVVSAIFSKDDIRTASANLREISEKIVYNGKTDK